MNKEELQTLLERAAAMSIQAHCGQRDKVGSAYFQHPMRVAMRCATDEEKIVAFLHDVIEDANITPEQLLERGFTAEIVDAVIAVTHAPGESYEEFVERAARNRIGRLVKLHDLEDNLDIYRLEALDARMMERYNRYLKAHRYLSDLISNR